MKATLAAGWVPDGEPHIRPKHVELTARRDGGALMRLHVDRDGVITKVVPAAS